MEMFEERLARLSELGPEELVALEQELVAAFEAADQSGDIDSMQRLADAIEAVRNATSKPEAAATATAPATPAQPVTTGSGNGEGEGDTEEDASSDEDGEAPEVSTPEEQPAEQEEAPEAESVEETPEVEEVPVAPETVEETPETVEEAPAPEAEVETTVEAPAAEVEAPVSEDTPEVELAVAASATTDESEESVETTLTDGDVPEENTPVPAGPVVTIRAGGDVPGYTAGSVIADMDGAIEALTAKIGTMRNVRGDGEHIVVASMRVEEDPPENRVLRVGDMQGNSRKIRELLQDQDLLRSSEALTAAAWCAPRAPIYSVPTIGTTSRPVADSLPTFTADRGGITWMQPPGVGNTDGIGLWRHDGTSWESFGYSDPPGTGTAGTVKPCATIACGTEQSLDVDALTLCLCFSNMTARAFPEWVRANTDLVMVHQSRFAEQVLLSRMFGTVTSGSANPGTQVGVARDFLIVVRTAAANFRWEKRLGQRAPLQLLAPSWVAEAMAADLDLQSPGDDTYGTSLGEVTSVFNEIGIDPIWYIDDVPGTPAFSSETGYPTTAHWLLFPTGAFVRLDSGELNLGVVRDMDNVQANTYCEFSETFETVAYMGPASPNAWVYRGSTNVDLAGSSGAPRTITIS